MILAWYDGQYSRMRPHLQRCIQLYPGMPAGRTRCGIDSVEPSVGAGTGHNNCPDGVKYQCCDTDQPSVALVTELKERGLLGDTLVVWAGESGRTVHSQGTLASTNYGRDPHPICYSIWMADGGIKGGMMYGESDNFSYTVVSNPVDIHDLTATIPDLYGYDHESLT